MDCVNNPQKNLKEESNESSQTVARSGLYLKKSLVRRVRWQGYTVSWAIVKDQTINADKLTVSNLIICVQQFKKNSQVWSGKEFSKKNSFSSLEHYTKKLF